MIRAKSIDYDFISAIFSNDLYWGHRQTLCRIELDKNIFRSIGAAYNCI